MGRTERVVAQTRSRLAGVMPESASRLVSLHDVDARPIRKGRLGKPVEFGYKAQIVDNADGVILDHNVEIGNPPDAPQLAPAIERITRRTGRTPRAVTADRGYGEASVERDLHELGVRSVAIPRKSKPSAARREFEHRRAFRDKIKWRTGSEGRINHIKRSYGWNRTELTGINGARTWCGHGVFAHNLVKIGDPRSMKPTPEPSPQPTTPDPSTSRRQRLFQVEVASMSEIDPRADAPLVDWSELGVSGLLPTGTVTLLLADVEGSTRLWETQPEEMTAARSRVSTRSCCDVIAAHDGVRPVEQGEGDSFVAAFARASDAVAAALELQRAPLAPIRLRIGVHTGEVQLRDEGNYAGPTINRTARLRDLGHGGQTVLSGATEQLVVDRLPDGVWLTDLGSHPLRDLPRPERVVQLCHPDLVNEFPPLRTSKAVAASNLPVQLTSFVGSRRAADPAAGAAG